MGDLELSWHDTDIAVVKLLGEHDLSDQDELAKKLRQPLQAGDLLVVDLSETEFFDSSVIRNLIIADRLATERGLTMTLQATAGSNNAHLLEIAGLESYCRLAHSRVEAIRLARASRRSPSERATNSSFAPAATPAS